TTSGFGITGRIEEGEIETGEALAVYWSVHGKEQSDFVLCNCTKHLAFAAVVEFSGGVENKSGNEIAMQPKQSKERLSYGAFAQSASRQQARTLPRSNVERSHAMNTEEKTKPFADLFEQATR